MIASLWSRLYGWVIGAALALAGLAALYFKGRAAGKEIEQQKATQRDLDAVRAKSATIQEAHDVESKVVRMPDADVRQRLQDRWTRD